jgi:HEAT repeat protein
MRFSRRWVVTTLIILTGITSIVIISRSPRPVETGEEGRQLDEWVDELNNSADPDSQCRAARALARMGPAAGPAAAALIAVLDGIEVPEEVHSEAAEALCRIGGAAVPELARAVKDPGRPCALRKRVANILGRLGPVAANAEPALRQALKETWMKWVAADALIQIDTDLDETLPALIDAVTGEHPEDSSARRLLDEIVRLGPAATTGLRAVTDGPNHLARLEAAALLYRIGSAKEQMVNLLTRLLEDPTPEVRARASARLVDLGPQAAIPPLLAVLNDAKADGESRATAANGLARFGPSAAGAVPSLINTLQNSYYPLQAAAAGALERIGPAAVPPLAPLLGADDGQTRRLTADCLVHIQPEGVAALRKALESEEAGVRDLAVEFLVRNGHTPRPPDRGGPQGSGGESQEEINRCP